MAALTFETVDVPVASVSKQLRIHFRFVGVRAWRRRLRLAAWLVRIAARVAGCDVEVTLDSPAEAIGRAAADAAGR